MDLLYSITLLVSLTTGALSHLAGLLALARTWRLFAGELESSWTQRICRGATTGALVSVAFSVVSIAVHLTFGHRPGTTEGLGPKAFFAIHPAYLGALFMAAIGALLANRATSRLEGL